MALVKGCSRGSLPPFQLHLLLRSWSRASFVLVNLLHFSLHVSKYTLPSNLDVDDRHKSYSSWFVYCVPPQWGAVSSGCQEVRKSSAETRFPCQISRLQDSEHGWKLWCQVPNPTGGPGSHPSAVQQVCSCYENYCVLHLVYLISLVRPFFFLFVTDTLQNVSFSVMSQSYSLV